jgi:hypothetical protein
MKHLKSYILFEATLPKSHLEDRQIKNMKIGQTGYVTPWSMKVDENGECFIDGNTQLSQKGGTVCLRIKRRNDGFICYLSELPDDYKKFTPTEIDPIYKSKLLDVIGFDDNTIEKEDTIEDLELKVALGNEDYEKSHRLKIKIDRKKKL